MISVLILFLSVVGASALCSMAEAAVLSLPLIRARILYEQNRRHAKDLLYLKENISHTLACIVILNNSINIAGSIFIGEEVAMRFGNQWLAIASTVMTFSIIVAGEIIPKTIGERHKIPLSLFFAKPLRLILWIMRPVIDLVLGLTKPFLAGQPLHPRATEEEIRIMLQMGRAEGTVETDEEVLCGRVFKLNDVRAAQIMRPIDQIYALPADKTLEELKEAIISSRFSRIAVYDKDPHDIVGTVQQRTLLAEIAKDNYRARVRDFMTKPVFVNWLIKADALLEKFQAYNQHLFIVQDSHGKDVGVVTMEDVLEELFGEIYDEKDIVKAGPPERKG
ncbi:MAG: HlyC/CorC family transporter [Candidatus Omnitrophica bacterium]|nr:HlyC/CorC family transporter [Candidatus Omnitrophota bacterium]